MDAQAPEARSKIEDAILQHAARFKTGATLSIPFPATMVTAIKQA